MTRLGQLPRPQPTLRSCGLLLCALLLGLLGMHGLGPMPAGVHTSSEHGRMTAVAHTGIMASAPGGCDHGAGGCTGHTEHADPTCASASVAGTPLVAPVLLPDTVTCADPAQTGPTSTAGGPDGGRAPPSLAELQLLRI
ncbi:DUF6153 family protein [Streptomyces sp. NPDC002588]|uniref:DUF6153 family protein n=1 Tax=Streptomyces sp. NPDC002588 TaxID=3154419 RepID=UPI003331FF26